MKHTVRECLGLFGEITALISDYKMPIGVKFKLNLLLQKVQPTAELYQKERQAFFEKYGEKETQDGKEVYVLSNEHVELYSKQFGELEAQDGGVEKISFLLSDLEKIEGAGTGNFPTLFSIIVE